MISLERARTIAEQGCFLTAADVAELAVDPDTADRPVLVRYQDGREVCAVADVPLRIAQAGAALRHVRDVSLLADLSDWPEVIGPWEAWKAVHWAWHKRPPIRAAR